MARSRIALIAALAAALVASAGTRAQMPPISAMKGEVGLGLLLRQLKTTAVLMQATAHPDDENNAMLAATGWGQGVRTVVVSATRGDGGQNEIGPELFDALAMLRSRGLEIGQIQQEPWGRYALFTDPDGNYFQLTSPWQP